MRSAQEIWEVALGELQLQINKPNYQTWFQGTRGAAYQDGQSNSNCCTDLDAPARTHTYTHTGLLAGR